MSAIAGIYHTNEEPVPFEHSSGIMKALQKYPADDVQTWNDRNIFLGCHAQWITPESIGEQLPYHDYESKLTITADAIIDNRDELFDKLQVDHSYRKQMNDSELILRTYQKWGEASPKYLVGDFAFMIWDEREHRLFGARDFSGRRTLYFYRNGQRFAFCTTIMPLFSLPYIEKMLNEQWLAEFLAMPDMTDTVDTSSTSYKNIEQIPPSHSISVVDGKAALTRYCTLTAGMQLKLKSDQEYVEAFLEVFQTAVTEHSRTHRQVGAHLSGGLDSGSVVSLASQALLLETKKLHTFSYIPVKDFKDWTHKSRLADERPYIQSTVQHAGNIQDHYLDFEGKSPLSEVDDWLETMEMPYKFFENSFWIKGIYEEAEKLGMGILLDGSKGNYTISWGSALEHYTNLIKRIKWIRLNRELQLYIKHNGTGRKRVLSMIWKKGFPFINRLFSSNDPEPFPMFIHPELATRTGVFDKFREQGIDPTGLSVPNAYNARKRQFEQLCYLNLGGSNGTKLSLRHSMWERDPTNDLRVVRFCLSLPDHQFVQNGLDRALIRRSMKGILPEKVRLNQRVRGIQGADGVHRMKTSWKPFIEEIESLCADSAVSGILNLRVIRAAALKLREPRPEYAYEAELKVLMRSLIVYRFIKKLA